MFLKKVNNFFILFLFCSTLLIVKNISALETKNDSKELVISYIENLNNFSSKFLQVSDENFSNGYFYLKDKRIKIEYTDPVKIQIIISKNKAMYYNKDLKEVEYFKPKNTMANIFYEVFFDKVFFDDAIINTKKDLIFIKKNIKSKEAEFNLEIFFENNPYILRKIIINNQNEKTIFSIINPNYNANFKKNFFSMVNPEIN